MKEYIEDVVVCIVLVTLAAMAGVITSGMVMDAFAATPLPKPKAAPVRVIIDRCSTVAPGGRYFARVEFGGLKLQTDCAYSEADLCAAVQRLVKQLKSDGVRFNCTDDRCDENGDPASE